MQIKDGSITLDCKACGQRSDVDPRLKLSSFIIKHAPKKGKKDKSTKKADRKARKEREAKGENGHNSGEEGSPNGSGNGSDANDDNGDVELEAGSDDELTRRINAEAKELDDDVEEKEIEWTVDTSAEAQKARAAQLADDLKKQLAVNGDDEDQADGEGNPYDALGGWLEDEAKANGGVSKVDDVEIYKKAQELGIEKKHKTLAVLAQAMFDDNIVKQVDSRAAMLKKVNPPSSHTLQPTALLTLTVDDHVGPPRKGPPWRHRALRRRHPARARAADFVHPDEVLRKRPRVRGGAQGVGLKGQQKVRRHFDEQKGAQVGREVHDLARDGRERRLGRGGRVGLDGASFWPLL